MTTSAYRATAQVFKEAGVRTPPNQPDLEKLLSEREGEIDASFIITPQARCGSMQRGLPGQNTKPNAVAPHSTAHAASSIRVMPQIFTSIGSIPLSCFDLRVRGAPGY